MDKTIEFTKEFYEEYYEHNEIFGFTLGKNMVYNREKKYYIQDAEFPYEMNISSFSSLDMPAAVCIDIYFTEEMLKELQQALKNRNKYEVVQNSCNFVLDSTGITVMNPQKEIAHLYFNLRKEINDFFYFLEDYDTDNSFLNYNSHSEYILLRNTKYEKLNMEVVEAIKQLPIQFNKFIGEDVYAIIKKYSYLEYCIAINFLIESKEISILEETAIYCGYDNFVLEDFILFQEWKHDGTKYIWNLRNGEICTTIYEYIMNRWKKYANNAEEFPKYCEKEKTNFIDTLDKNGFLVSRWYPNQTESLLKENL